MHITHSAVKLHTTDKDKLDMDIFKKPLQ